MRRIGTTALVACAISSLIGAGAGEEERRLTFDVYLSERPIGTHEFALRETPAGLRMETRASLELEVLRMRAFAYAHHNVEHWRAGCLESIESRTDSNGKQFRVSGSRRDDAFVVAGSAGEQTIAECVGTFSYWDKAQLLARASLLNSQTGEYLPVRTTHLGTETLALHGHEIAVERYAIRGEGLRIELAYARDDGEWIALDSKLAGGLTLRYRRSAAELGKRPKPRG